MRASQPDNISLNTSQLDLVQQNYTIEIKVNNALTSEQYIWETNKFRDRLIVMRDLLATYEDDGEIPENQENPFVDVQEPFLIG